jgi:two-component system NtrC family sensor kinase
MEKIRIFDKEGRITYTTDPSELNHVVDKRAEACYACHAQAQPLTRLNRPDRPLLFLCFVFLSEVAFVV